jgi:hypothetical protein
MKQIIRLGNNRYIHLDSYPSLPSLNAEHFKFVMTILVLAIAGMTAAAMVGIDITNPTPTQHQSK